MAAGRQGREHRGERRAVGVRWQARLRGRGRRPSASQRATTGPTGASSVTRWAASGNRSTSAWGMRARRSARNRSWKTGSRPPHRSSVGRGCSSSTAAHVRSAAYDGSAGVTGMSATKSRTASRRSARAVGGTEGVRCARPVIRAVPATKAGVRRQLRSTRLRAAAISGGTATSSGLATAVLARIERLDVERARGTHGDRSAPVVGGQHEGAVHLLATEGDQFGDPVGQSPGPVALGPAHARSGRRR